MTVDKPLGGRRRSVTDKLPRGHFNEINTRLWEIGYLAMSGLLANPMAPSSIASYPIGNETWSVQLGFEFRVKPDSPETPEDSPKIPVPVYCSGILSHLEPHKTIDDTVIATWLSFGLDLRTRRKTFLKGTSLYTPDGEVVLSTAPPIGRNRLPGGAQWRDIAQLDKVCTLDDYRQYLYGLDQIYEHLTSGAEASED